jgi:ssDNA thymidine ADP-ribosyltransferase, DarT
MVTLGAVTPLTHAEVIRLVGEGTSLTRASVAELQCIQALENVESILEKGILSHNLAEAVPHVSIANPKIQERRERVTIPGARDLHDYANLYFNARNKMMSYLHFTRGTADLVVLRVSPDVLDLDGVVIASENASTGRVIFTPAPGGLARVKSELVYAQSWNHPDQSAKDLHGALICAEVLVPDKVEPSYIRGAFVPSAEARDALRGLVPVGFGLAIDADKFFL